MLLLSHWLLRRHHTGRHHTRRHHIRRRHAIRWRRVIALRRHHRHHIWVHRGIRVAALRRIPSAVSSRLWWIGPSGHTLWIGSSRHTYRIGWRHHWRTGRVWPARMAGHVTLGRHGAWTWGTFIKLLIELATLRTVTTVEGWALAAITFAASSTVVTFATTLSLPLSIFGAWAEVWQSIVANVLS